MLLLSAGLPKQTHDLDSLVWLVGTWENHTPRGTVFEAWKKVSEQELRGMSYMLNQEDTVVLETIQIIQEKDGLWYIPTVNNQNDGEPVRFEKTNLTDRMVQFENPQHDFPQVITYERVSADSLVAVISGNLNGQPRSHAFPMKRSGY